MRRTHATKTILLCMLIFVSVSYLIAPVEAVSPKNVSTEQTRVSLAVLGADYADTDGDMVMNDAIVWFDILLSGDTRYTLTLILSLTLPSGKSYSYTYIIITSYSVLHCTMYFYDHATEPGYYLFNATAILRSGGRCVSSVEYQFDPPGGSGDIDPCGALFVA